MRFFFLISLLALAACQRVESAPTAQPTQERNFVCERVALANPKAQCAPELSGVGDLSTHTARVTIGSETLSCAINAAQVGVVCGPLFVTPQPAPQAPAQEPKQK